MPELETKNPLVRGALSAGAGLYRTGLWAVELMYQGRLRKVHQLPVPVVSIGNITWGGTGKTPMVIQLARALSQEGRRVAVLTRGYGQDEAQLLRNKLQPIPVLVGADRVATGQQAIQEFGADLLLLDDGYQQWRLKKDVEILMVDATNPFGNQRLIPRGSLREPLAAVARAQLVVITRADLNPDGLPTLEWQIRRHNPTAAIFHAHYQPIGLTSWPTGREVGLGALKGERIATMAGLADPKQFEKTAQALNAHAVIKYRAADHHPYSPSELIRLFGRCRAHGVRHIVTTAKDAVRIPENLLAMLGPDLKGISIWILQVVLELEPHESELLHRIHSLLANPRS